MSFTHDDSHHMNPGWSCNRKLSFCLFILSIFFGLPSTIQQISGEEKNATNEASISNSGGELADVSGVGSRHEDWFHALEGARLLAESGVGSEAARIMAAIASEEAAGDAREEALEWMERWDLTIDFIRGASSREIQSQIQSIKQDSSNAESLILHLSNLIALNRLQDAVRVLSEKTENDDSESVEGKVASILEHLNISLDGLDAEKSNLQSTLLTSFRKAHARLALRRRLPLLEQVDHEAMEIAEFLLHHQSFAEDEHERHMDHSPFYRWVESRREQKEEDHREDKPSLDEVASHAVQRVLSLATPHPHAAMLLAETVTTFAPESLASQAAEGILSQLKLSSSLAKAPAPARPREDTNSEFWKDSSVRHYQLELSDDAIEALQKSPKEYARGTFRDQGQVYEDVGVRLKGGWGSFRMMDGRSKAAFTVKFNQFKSGQRFHGLRRIVLNNAAQDPSYMRESVGYSLFRDAQIPAPRITHATLSVNGSPYGFYVQVEAVTKDFLKRWFEDASGNLYEGPGDVMEWEHLDLDSNQNKEDRSDLKRLAQAIEEAGEDNPWSNLDDHVELSSFTTFLCLEQFVNHWDGYTQVNNYRIYHHPLSDKFFFFPHGADQLFEELDQHIFRPQGGILGRALLMTNAGKRIYRQTAQRLLDEVWNEERILARIGEMYVRIHPHVASQEGLGRPDILEFERGVHEMIRFITLRRYVIQQQLQESPSPSWREHRDHREEMRFLWQD